MALGSQDSRYILAKSRAAYFPERLWPSHPWVAITVGTSNNPATVTIPAAITLFESRLLKASYKAKTPRPIHIEKA